MNSIRKCSTSELLSKLDNIINNINEVKQAIKDNDDFNEVLMTEEVSMSRFKESEKTLKSTRGLRNDHFLRNEKLRNENLEKEYKDYMDIDSMPSILY